MELRQIWEIIWLRKWIVIQAFLVITITAVIACYLVSPIYKASSKVLYETSDATSSILSGIGLESLSSLITTSDPIDTIIELATLAPILDKVIQMLQLKDKYDVSMTPDDLQEWIPILSTISPKPYVQIEQVEDTDIFEIEVTSSDPKEAAMIANTLAEVYISESLEWQRDEYSGAKDFIEKQLGVAKYNFLQALEDIKEFQIKESTINIEVETELGIEKMAELMKEKEDNIIDIFEVKAKIKTLKSQLASQNEDLVSSSTVSENPHIELLKRTLSNFELQLAGLLEEKDTDHPSIKEDKTIVLNSAIDETSQIEELKKSISDLELELSGVLTEKRRDHPEVMVLKDQIENTKAELKKEIENFKIALEQKITSIKAELKKEIKFFNRSSQELQVLERDLAALEAHLKGVNEDIDKYLSLLYTIPDKVYNYAQLELKITAIKDIYGSLLEYVYQIGVAEAMALADIRLVEPATEQAIDKPEFPNKPLMISLSAFLGLMFGMGLAFLIDYLDDSIKTADDVKAQSISLLGIIPKIRKKESSLIHGKDPKDPLIESYRTLRFNLKFASPDKPLKSLLITSALENEGKTTNVVNLGISMTHEAKKILIMDIDLRRPSIHKKFGLTNSKGITSILSGEATLKDAIIKTDIKGLSLLTSGPVPPDPGRMIESEKMRNLIKDVTQQYDLVLIDTPPTLVINDAIILAKNVDAFIIVLESGKITTRALTQVKEHFQKANIYPIGLILNKYKIENKHYYYSYYYRSSYYRDK